MKSFIKYGIIPASGSGEAGPSAPVNTVPPTIAFDAGVTGFDEYPGSEWWVDNNGTYDVTPDSYEYQWFYVGGGDIEGATNNSYVLTAADVALDVSCRVTPINGGGSGDSTEASNEVTVVGFENTAFLLSTGNDGTAVLNDPARPFITTAAATAALEAGSAPYTIRPLDAPNFAGSLAGISHDLTIAAHGSGDLNGALLLGDTGVNLTLIGVVANNVQVPARSSGTTSAAGTITGAGGAYIGLITLNYGGVNGNNGDSGTSANANGNSGASGSDGDPPINGYNGDSGGTAAAGDGTDGEPGSASASIILDGIAVTSTVNAFGFGGGTGGKGGDANASGGNGGSGGNATGTDQNGANGGDGGYGGTATAGGGGAGGKGGDGGIITLINGASVTGASANFGAGSGGSPGAGGDAYASGGSGGAGGNYSGSGTTGSNGSNGMVGTYSSGSPGAPGTDGTIGGTS